MFAVNQLLAEAKRKTELSAFIFTDFLPGFEAMVDSLNKDVDLSDENEKLVNEYLLRILVNRLRMDEDIRQHPEILEQEVLPPVVISSLPRTGSTMLHRMLAETGDFFSMVTWQEHNIAPFPDAAPEQPDPRIQDCYDYIDWIKQRSPRANEAHPMEAEEVEEESVMMGLTCRTLFLHIAYFNITGFAEWVMQQDVRIAYADLRRMLQYLQWQYYSGQSKPWILKTPFHLGNEAAFLDVFPSTRFIATHRDPVKIIPSTCSLLCGYRKLFSDEDFSQIAGPWSLMAFNQLLSLHTEWRNSDPAARIKDIGFSRLMSEPIAAVKEIYAFLGVPFSESTEKSCADFLQRQNKSSHAKHSYSMEEFGLSEQQIEEAFKEYSEHFSVYL